MKLSVLLVSKLTEDDLTAINNYTDCLAQTNQFRLVIRFLNKVIKYVPDRYADIRRKMIKTMSLAMKKLNHPKNKFY